MIVTVSGHSGSGKTTVSRELARRLEIPVVDVGSIFRALALEYGMDIITFGRYAQEHPEIDRRLDRRMIRLCRNNKRLVLQGRLAGWMTERYGIEAYRIWIEATARTRAKRIAEREHLPYRKAYADTKRRDDENRRRYLRTYGLDLNDLSIYDTVIQTDNLAVDEVVSALTKAISKVWPKKPKSKTIRRSRRPRPPQKRIRAPRRSRTK